jgi:hypothetical protein
MSGVLQWYPRGLGSGKRDLRLAQSGRGDQGRARRLSRRRFEFALGSNLATDGEVSYTATIRSDTGVIGVGESLRRPVMMLVRGLLKMPERSSNTD